MKICKKLVNYFFLLFYSGTLFAAPVPFIIDTDVGIDDAIAMLYLFSKPEVEVKAITIESDGLSPCRIAFYHATGLLALVGKPHIPLACGSNEPMAGGHVFPAIFREHQKKWLNTNNFFPQVNQPVAYHAVDLMLAVLHASKEPVTILAIGPLTNLAQALQKDPGIKQKIRRVYCMGGAVNVPGNVGDEVAHPNRRAEWNIYADPQAAAIVLRELPVTLVPLDVTNQLPINQHFYQQLSHRHASRAAKYLYQVVKNHQQLLQSGGWYFWDVVAAVAATHQSLFSFEHRRLQVSLSPQTQGSLVSSPAAQVVEFATAVDKTAFNKNLLETIG